MATAMKLRVRAANGGPTIRVQVRHPGTLQCLKDALVPLLSLPANAFYLSLNKKDVISGPGSAMLSSFGVTSGDLLFYILGNNSDMVSPVTSATSAMLRESMSRASAINEPVNGSCSETVSLLDGNDLSTEKFAKVAGSIARDIDEPGLHIRELCASAAARRASAAVEKSIVLERLGASEPVSPCTAEDGAQPSSMFPNPLSGQSLAEDMDSEAEVTIESTSYEQPESSDGSLNRYHSMIPDLLQRVLSTEVANVHRVHDYLILAIHAVMLETRFVRCDTQLTGITSQDYGLHVGWSNLGLVNLRYTLPELRNLDGTAARTTVEVLLRCQIVGKAVVVYGAVTGGALYRLSLSVAEYISENFIAGQKVLPAALQEHGSETLDGSTSSRQFLASLFHDVFQVWKEVKDRLSLPLLTDLCMKVGLPPPPSLLLLPTELKLRVLGALPAQSLAMVECVCSELRFLAASDDFWRRKFKEEFGDKVPTCHGWRKAFAMEWERRKIRENNRREAERRFRAQVFPPSMLLRPPNFAPCGPVVFFGDFGGGSIGGLGELGGADVSGRHRTFGVLGGLPGRSSTLLGFDSDID